ncbi:acyl-CoA dehydrogenase family protein [uncultured Abyssibacter sp.]|uniref:acyl-CoA dehydrogenase family protein n=1 Tax=uncultured Abyssibacter sp. TaxID=2320202 RepID=UPI0032B2701A|tara:strand:- start:160 stop:1308 length:1149 start_codon:yes stop_codon:yes gene_type:complete
MATKHSEYLGTAREIALSLVREQADQIYADRIWPERSIRELQRAGLGGLAVPTELGGLGGGASALAEICEVLGEQCASTAICFGMHCVGSAVIAAHATPAQQSELLEPICEGEHITTLALSEPGTGAHFYLPQTQILADDNGYVLNGRKTFVTNGNHAESYVLSGVSAADGLSFSCAVAPQGSPGMTWSGAWTGMGMRGNSSLQLSLDNVAIPRSHLLGNEGDQIWYVFHVVAPYFLMAMSGVYLGIAQAAFNAAREHVTRRAYAHTGALLADTAVLQHRIGQLWGELEKTRQLVHAAAKKFDVGTEDALLAVMAAKAEVADCVVKTVNEAMTLCGGMAYRDAGPLERYLHDARAAHVMAPTTDTLRTWIGRAALDLPLLGD